MTTAHIMRIVLLHVDQGVLRQWMAQLLRRIQLGCRLEYTHRLVPILVELATEDVLVTGVEEVGVYTLMTRAMGSLLTANVSHGR